MNFLRELNSKQREAVQCVEGPLTVVAGPGSGKTRVLTYRISYLISIGVPAYQILALTFTNRAANEMKSRIIQLVGEKSSQVWMGTFHSIFARILRRECDKLGFEKNFSIYDTADSLSLIKNVMDEIGIPTQQFNPQAIRSRISIAKNQLISPDEAAQQANDLFDEKCAVIYHHYQVKLKKNNAMDFDDLLQKPIELFRHHKQLLEKYQGRFRFILIDEYQDTNRAQYTIVNLLASRYKNICVVGDDAQSIYSFRGADLRNMLDFERDYPDRKLIRLEQNYRSTKVILRAADTIIKNNLDQIEKNLWTDNGEGENITILDCADDREEGSAIVEKIYEEVRGKNADLKDIAVMYRTNAQSRALEDALRRNSIPYTIVGGIEFYQRKEIKDVLAYFRLLVNPRDDESFQRVFNYPVRGIGVRGLEKIKSVAVKENLSLLDASGCIISGDDLSQKTRRGLTEFFDLIAKYRGMLTRMSISELSRSLVDEIGILKIFKEEGRPESMARWENVQELLAAISEFGEKYQHAVLEDFLQDVALVSALDELDSSPNSVTLLTLHSAKGLEFPLVFISGLEEGLVPFYSNTLDQKELEEERRLCYVGITRAMKKVYLSHVHTRYRAGELTYQTPSRFLEEMGKEGIEIEHRTVRSRPVWGDRYEKSRKSDPVSNSNQEVADDHYHRDVMPDYENDGGGNEPHVGELVEHEIFGRGKVLVISGKGESRKAVVDFSTVGRKNLLLRYARLKVL
jgi:DNA helicase-2/ATP-dependent DNA helicase PcrA